MASPAKSFNPLPKSDLPKRLRHVRKNVACRQASVSMRGVLVRIKAPRLPKLRKRRRREGEPAREFALTNPVKNFVTHVSTRFPCAGRALAVTSAAVVAPQSAPSNAPQLVQQRSDPLLCFRSAFRRLVHHSVQQRLPIHLRELSRQFLRLPRIELRA